MKNNNVSIFIAAHKKFNEPNYKIYIPLHVGAKGKKDLGYKKDSTGKNISDKNSNYCELTGLYWIWKNYKASITGLVHYRRYFFLKSRYHTLDKILNEEEICDILNVYDIILPKKLKVIEKNTRLQFSKYHNVSDYDVCRDVIKELYPEYLVSFDKISNARSFYAYNMMITNKKIFDSYCEWLFNILFEVEKKVDITNYSNYDKRLFGFLSERLLNVWVDYNQLKIKELPVYNIEEKYLKQRVIEIVKNIIIH
ncbi:MAG: DUF4422 domain-containing protein [Bacilli bacterium]|nr:DUF4422 domain-containing protein [Bacilli bacterium]